MTDGDGTPLLDTLISMIGILLPDRPSGARRRRMIAVEECAPTRAELETAFAALSDQSADRHVDGEVVVSLLRAVDRLKCNGADMDAAAAMLAAHVERRWTDLVPSLADKAIDTYERASLFAAFPRLRRDPVLIPRLIEAISDPHHHVGLVDILNDIAPDTVAEARLLIVALDERHRGDGRRADSLTLPVFAAIGRGLRWTPWIALQTMLRARPDYARPRAAFERSGDPSKESEAAIGARLEVARAIEPLREIRGLAEMLLQLLGASADRGVDGLLHRPAEVRAAYVDGLRVAIAGDVAVRRAVIEALLWSADGRTAQLAQFAAVALTESADRPWLLELEAHPVQMVRHGARAVRAAKFGEPLIVPTIPVMSGIVHSLAAIEGGTAADEPARTWLGDRAAEQLIERTVASIEMRFARDYEAHGDEGEDRILSTLFATLALRFGDLDHALEALARAASAPSRAAVTMRYRNVDRAEEGRMGVRGARSFSADLCLIVDPILDGTSLGRRVTLVQAKRLYRDHAAAVQPTWDSSFAIDVKQRRALQKQTDASVYFFHGPPLGGRGVAVMPTQLVADLSEHQGSGGQLARTTVATASRSLADWFTYDALALRTGDPYAKLVAKAEGRPGSLPRRLLHIPTVEIEVAIVRRSGDR